MAVAHGEHSVSMQEDIIYTKVIGAFNEFGIKNYTDTVMTLVKQREGKPFAVLVDNTKLEGATPEAFQLLESYNLWMNQQNMIAKALVFNVAILATITQSQTPSLCAENVKICKSIEEAQTWLELKIDQYKIRNNSCTEMTKG
ncbi:hypothetical protein [Shewanella aestuarii]|uniref:STAS/SEC14 domain-containing protein n=1 Tax=Shewanella aestuarii TaxID=1028752 RepID=A0A6G9QIJ2_9GAMM|nr:hypothetical protein [Shewanella aestuarii]QIR13699.1 hypothetical protein HBH39_03590 [Shewanella aestuarii]